MTNLAPLRTLLVAWLALVTTTACDHEHHVEHETGRFPVTHPVRKDVELTRDYVCQLHAIQHIELRALEQGYLEGIFADEGQLVPAGQRMFQVMQRVYEAELARAQAEVSFCEIEYENTRKLAADEVVAASELALAEAKLRKAEAERDLARVHRDLTEVRAPFEGIMGRFHVRLGSLLEDGELLTTLSDASTVWAYFNVSEAEYLDYVAAPREEGGEPVQLVLANGRTFEQPGRVETIESDFNNETGNIAFRATFPNPDRVLRHGQTGKVVLTKRLEDVLVIPQKATFEVLDKQYVYVVDDDHVVHSRRIVVAEELPHVYVLESGLEPSDTVLLEGLRRVHEGAPIDVEERDPAEVLATLELHAE